MGSFSLFLTVRFERVVFSRENRQLEQVMTRSDVPNHLAIIPNGNRRFARSRDISYEEAYHAGGEKAYEVVGWAREVGIQHVTLFGLSCENIARRPESEIDALSVGAEFFLSCVKESRIALHVFGNIDVFREKPKYAKFVALLDECQATTYDDSDFVVHVAVNYSGKPEHELAPLLSGTYFSSRTQGQSERRKVPYPYLLSAGVPDVDMVLRTGGEQRTSGILPFQIGYAEHRFLTCMWPEYERMDFDDDMAWYANQPRNFGK